MAFRATGHPLQLMLTRQAAGNELSSQISRTAFKEAIQPRAGIARTFQNIALFKGMSVLIGLMITIGTECTSGVVGAYWISSSM